jgi:hypothetical protein
MTPSFLHEAQLAADALSVAERTTPDDKCPDRYFRFDDGGGDYYETRGPLKAPTGFARLDVVDAALRHLAEKLTRAEARIAALRAGVDAIFARGRDYGFACEWCRIAEAARDADENVAALSSPAVPSFPSDEDMFAQAKVFCAAQGIDLDTLVHDAAVAMRDRTPGRFVFDETLPFADEPKAP